MKNLGRLFFLRPAIRNTLHASRDTASAIRAGTLDQNPKKIKKIFTIFNSLPHNDLSFLRVLGVLGG